MDFTFSTHQLELEKRCTHFAEKEIIPHLVQLEENLSFRRSLFQKMAKEGLLTLTISPGDNLAYSLALKTISKADAGIAVAMAVTNMVAEMISRYGTEEQRKKYLPAIGRGECVPLSFALTEKEAGSDVKSLQCEAKSDPRDADFFIIGGEKQFITNGDLSNLIIVMAKGPQGITAFLVDQGTTGMSVVKKERKLGLLTANLVDLKFEGCRIHKNQALGVEGQGLKIALSALDSGRIGIAAQAMGIAEAAYEAALNYSKKREQFGHRICDNQAIAFKLVDMKVKISSGLLLLYKAAWLKDQGKSYTQEASEAKLYCSEACNEIANDALQIFGGYGYVKDYPAEKYFRDARVTTLYEGTSEIQRIVISRHILSL